MGFFESAARRCEFLSKGHAAAYLLTVLSTGVGFGLGLKAMNEGQWSDGANAIPPLLESSVAILAYLTAITALLPASHYLYEKHVGNANERQGLLQIV
jgi:hypothetical protein